jgi:hypothetical protein
MQDSLGKPRPAALLAAGLAGIAWLAAAVAAIDDPAAPEPIPRPAPAATAPAAVPPEPVRDGRCDRCGGCERVGTVCVKRLTEKEVTKVCWGYRCEQVCIPGPSIFIGTRHHKDDCGCWTCRLWRPTCAEVITRRVPEKKEVKRKVPAVAWTVEERCCKCRHEPRPTRPAEPDGPPAKETAVTDGRPHGRPRSP